MRSVSRIAVAASLLLVFCTPQTSEAFVISTALLSSTALNERRSASATGLHAATTPITGLNMQQQQPDTPPRALTRRKGIATISGVVVAAAGLAPRSAGADMLDIVSGTAKRDDFLARLKVGKVYLPTLSCNESMPCWNRDPNAWYDFPDEEELAEGYITSPSGLKIKDLAVNPDLKDLSLNSPSPDPEAGTGAVEVFIAGYLISPRYRTATDEALAEYYDPQSKKSKYYDLRNRDPRMFQLGKIALQLGKSKLIKGFEEGLSTMRVGMRRSIIIPPELGYGAAGADQGTGFLKPIPPNGQLLYQIELQKIIRG